MPLGLQAQPSAKAGVKKHEFTQQGESPFRGLGLIH